MKKFYILLALCLITISIQAKVIKVNDAIASAKTFCQQVLAQPDVINTSLELAYTETSATDKNVKTLYVFNKPQKKGFIVVAADDVVSTPILGYSDNGEFDYTNMPENLKWLLSMYSEQLDYLKAQGKNYANAQAVTQKDSIIIPPLMGNHLWNQQDPYNRLVPTDCPVGCVATSMTTVMYFHKWPLTGKGSKKYTENSRTHSIDFSKSTYNWAEMIPRYNGVFTEAQANAVSKLSYDAGVSVSMNYTTTGSGAYTNDAHGALKNYFTYNTDVKYKYMSGSRSSWNTIIMNELDNLRPVMYSGLNSKGGHAFVCDGYTKNEYFHFNFGWSGTGNGYYLSSLDDQFAKATENDFTKQQQLVYNINPDNKHLVDGIYYHILSSNEVEVCTPKSLKDYTGKIVIPNSVTIDATQYKVSRIGCAAFGNSTNITSIELPSSIEIIEGNAFFGCTQLDSIFVPWEKPLEVFSSTFYNDFTSKTVLVVPSGAVKNYSAAEGWNQFIKITDGKEKSTEWTAWEPFELGSCSYKQKALITHTYYNLKVYQRKLISDTTQVQLKVEKAGIYSAMDLIVNWNKQTNACQIEKQKYGFYESSYGHIYVSDMPHYNSSFSYKSYPCKYNPVSGVFELYMIYYCNTGSFGGGMDSLKVDGLVKDYSLSLSPYAIQELAEDSATHNISVKTGTDVSYVWCSTTKGNLSAADVIKYSEKIISGEVTHQNVVLGKENKVKVSYPVSGKYTTVFVVFSADSTSKGTFTLHTNYIANKNWKELGTAKYTDDFVSTAFPKVKQFEYDVIVEENTKHAGRYRILNPYGKGYPQNSKGNYTTDTVSVYLEINAEDANGVYIPHNQAMNITLNAKTQGEMSVSSKAGKAIVEGKTLEEVKADSICGTMTKGIITFPKNSLLEYFPLKSSEWAEANAHGTFKLDLSPYIPEGMKGDANDDGVVDVADITAIASYILSKTPEQWNADNADANSDNVIDVADITTTAGIILSK